MLPQNLNLLEVADLSSNKFVLENSFPKSDIDRSDKEIEYLWVSYYRFVFFSLFIFSIIIAAFYYFMDFYFN